MSSSSSSSLFRAAGPRANLLNLPLVIGGARLLGLIDSGSSGDFMNTDVAEALELDIEPNPSPTRVKLANGQTLTTDKVASKVPIKVGNLLCLRIKRVLGERLRLTGGVHARPMPATLTR